MLPRLAHSLAFLLWIPPFGSVLLSGSHSLVQIILVKAEDFKV
jgi:hypothetical protein